MYSPEHLVYKITLRTDIPFSLTQISKDRTFFFFLFFLITISFLEYYRKTLQTAGQIILYRKETQIKQEEQMLTQSILALNNFFTVISHTHSAIMNI